MSSRLCPYCMQMTDADTCPHCGKNTDYTCLPVHLPAGYVVHGKHPYVLGAALGQGGFGITYIALDMQTNERVAIKEYFPTFCANRTDGAVWAYPNQEEVFLRGKERFLDEARVLKSLSDLNSIVNVLDFFELNNSAYLVMEFLEGDSLKSHALKNGKLPVQKFLQQLKPLMEDIERMHQRGVVHRDIAPDNIILTPDGQMKLIDFGAARSYVGDKSMTVVVKKGFAPIEQYMRKGSSAYTDVYALAATIYYCITGVVPPDSAERQYDEDMLKSPISLGAELSKEQERAILKALEVQPKKRTQSVVELIKALEHAPKTEKPKSVKKTEKTKAVPQKKPKWILPVVAAVLVCILGGVLFLGKESPAAPVEIDPAQMAASEATMPETTVPEAPTDKKPEDYTGNLVIYSPNDPSPLEAGVSMFMETYPDINVEFLSMPTREAIQRIAAESENPQCDVLWGGGADTLAGQIELFQAFVSEHDAVIGDDYKDANDMWIGESPLPMCFIYNKILIDEADVPTTWEGLTDPALKGKIAYANPAKSGSAYTQLCTMLFSQPTLDEGWALVDKFIDNLDGKLQDASSACHKLVASGEYVLGVTLEKSAVLYADNPNIGFIYPEKNSAVPDCISLVRNCPNQENAELFINYILSIDVQKDQNISWKRRPVRSDLTPEGLCKLSELDLGKYDFAYAATEKENIVQKWKDLATD